jgi:hypothetical protein
MDLSTILQLRGKASEGLEHQARALTCEQIYTQPSRKPSGTHLRLLMLTVPGNLIANTPVEFILDGSNASLPGQHLPN